MLYDQRVPFWLELVVLALAGLVAGALNVIAGGGSFLILPLLIFFGLPASLANGTNRVGIMSQNLAGILGFHRHGAFNWAWALTASVPAVVGSALASSELVKSASMCCWNGCRNVISIPRRIGGTSICGVTVRSRTQASDSASCG